MSSALPRHCLALPSRWQVLRHLPGSVAGNRHGWRRVSRLPNAVSSLGSPACRQGQTAAAARPTRGAMQDTVGVIDNSHTCWHIPQQ